MNAFMCSPFLTDSSSSSTACIIGHIIAIAAVFEIHMDTNIVTAMRPKFNLFETREGTNKRYCRLSILQICNLIFGFTYFFWLHPMIEITLSAIRWCKLQCWTANAMTRPPMNISIVSFIYIMHVLSVSCWRDEMKKEKKSSIALLQFSNCIIIIMQIVILTNIPSNGKSTIGSIDVIAVNTNRKQFDRKKVKKKNRITQLKMRSNICAVSRQMSNWSQLNQIEKQFAVIFWLFIFFHFLLTQW